MIAYIQAHKTFVLVLTFALMAIASTWVNSSNKNLDTPNAPFKILSLELAWHSSTATLVVESWTKICQKGTAIYSIYIDCFFIITYVMFLSCCVMAANEPATLTSVTKFFLTCTVAAGVCDYLENLFMVLFLKNYQVPVFSFSLPSSIKFGLLALVASYLAYFLIKRYPDFLKALWLYLAGIVTVAMSYFIFIKLTQGQDVIMQVGEYSGPFLFSLLCIPMWSYVLWYSARLIGYVKREQTTGVIREAFHRHLPRIIAFNAFVSIQAAILALPALCNWGTGELWAFVLAQNAIYFIWSSYLSNPAPRKNIVFLFYISIIVCVGYAAFLISQVKANSPGPLLHKGFQFWLPNLALFLFTLQMAQVWFFIHRRKKIESAIGQLSLSKATPPNLTLFFFNIPMAPEFIEQERRPYWQLNIIATIGASLYVATFFMLGLTNRMGPLAVTLLAFAMLAGLSNVITFFSIRANVNIFFLLLVFTFMVGTFYDPYVVRLKRAPTKDVYKSRPTLEQYFWNWACHRNEKIYARKEKFPVYLVIADGGASRSGYWVASVLSALQDATISDNKKDLFSDHLLCLAGASGGSVGTATFYALLKNKLHERDTTCDYLVRSRAFIGQDFLSPVMAHWLGSDFFRHLIPFIRMPDRAAALELALEHFSNSDTTLNGAFARPLNDVLDATGRLPILFINTTHVQKGNPSVISSVHTESFSPRLDVLDMLDTLRGRSNINYSTAVVMGARFPYVSPAGRIGKEYFVDGGYFDNTGSGIVHEMMQYLDSMVYKCDTTLYNKLQFHLLHVSNTSLKVSPDKSIHPMINDLASPLITLASTYAEQTTINDQRLITFLRRIEDLPTDSIKTEINLYTDSTDYDYPMNWVISDYNLKRMDARLDTVRKYHFKEVHGKIKTPGKPCNPGK